jgi:hypothetical protein
MVIKIDQSKTQSWPHVGHMLLKGGHFTWLKKGGEANWTPEHTWRGKTCGEPNPKAH